MCFCFLSKYVCIYIFPYGVIICILVQIMDYANRNRSNHKKNIKYRQKLIGDRSKKGYFAQVWDRLQGFDGSLGDEPPRMIHIKNQPFLKHLSFKHFSRIWGAPFISPLAYAGDTVAVDLHMLMFPVSLISHIFFQQEMTSEHWSPWCVHIPVGGLRQFGGSSTNQGSYQTIK